MNPNPKLCPTDIIDQFGNYINCGTPPTEGSFFEALLLNDLMEAFKRADHINLENLPHIVAWIYWNVPSNIWRTRENIKQHLDKMKLQMDKVKAAALLLSKPMLEYQDDE